MLNLDSAVWARLLAACFANCCVVSDLLLSFPSLSSLSVKGNVLTIVPIS